MNFLKFLGEDLEGGVENFGGHGVADADALVAVGPRLVVFGQAEEEVFAWDDEDAERFEALVELFGRDGKFGEPEPEEECAFAAVVVPGEGIS